MLELTLPHIENPVQWQIRALVEAHTYSVIVIHRQAGKTRQGVVECIYTALTCPNPNPRTALLSEQLVMSHRNAKDYLWELAGVVPEVKFNETRLTADFPNGGRVSLFGADTPDTLRGLHHDLVVCDEFALMDPRTWPEVVLPTLLARNGKALLMGTVLSRHDPPVDHVPEGRHAGRVGAIAHSRLGVWHPQRQTAGRRPRHHDA